MSSSYDQDPWINVQTRHGLPGDEVISALQKEIRRGQIENAALLAYEMITTSPEMEAKLWQRLLAICVEDIGWGDVQAPVLIYTLYQMHQIFGRGAGERRLFAIHAVRYLCACAKDRSSDEMSSWIKQQVESNQLLPTIPDYALDMHTRRGHQMERSLRHFYEEGARIQPELPDRDTTYHQRLLELLKENE
ncbi:MAG: AAA family ATPase [Chloroflexi bacterium]|nr:AAA family ATPase [Chloroflexota bacterium]